MATVDLSNYDPNQVPSAKGMRFAIVVSDWNAEVTHALLKGAYETLVKHGAKGDDIMVSHVPGSFELVYASKMLMETECHAIIALGCVVRGGTPHFDYVCQGTTNGIAALNAADFSQTPVIFGLLTTDDMQQALDRAGGIHGNKGVECAVTAIKMVDFAKGVAGMEDL